MQRGSMLDTCGSITGVGLHGAITIDLSRRRNEYVGSTRRDVARTNLNHAENGFALSKNITYLALAQ